MKKSFCQDQPHKCVVGGWHYKSNYNMHEKSLVDGWMVLKRFEGLLRANKKKEGMKTQFK